MQHFSVGSQPDSAFIHKSFLLTDCTAVIPERKTAAEPCTFASGMFHGPEEPAKFGKLFSITMFVVIFCLCYFQLFIIPENFRIRMSVHCANKHRQKYSKNMRFTLLLLWLLIKDTYLKYHSLQTISTRTSKSQYIFLSAHNKKQ